MKKIGLLITGLSLVASSLVADVFVGVDYLPSADMTYTTDYGYGQSSESTNSLSGYTLSVGMGTQDSFMLEAYYSDFTPEKGSETYSELGLNMRPYFNISDGLSLYLEAGVGTGSTSSSESRTSLNLNAGAGVSYTVAKKVELNLGYMYKMQSWDDTETYAWNGNTYVPVTISTTSSGAGLYLGVNFWFGGETAVSAPATSTPPPASPAPGTWEDPNAY